MSLELDIRNMEVETDAGMIGDLPDSAHIGIHPLSKYVGKGYNTHPSFGCV